MNSKYIAVRVEKEDAHKLRVLSAMDDIPLSELLRRIIKDYLKGAKK